MILMVTVFLLFNYIMKLIMSLQKLTALPAENLAQHNMTHVYGDPVQQKYLEK